MRIKSDLIIRHDSSQLLVTGITKNSINHPSPPKLLRAKEDSLLDFTMFALVEKEFRHSSFTAIAKLRKVFQTKTIGHAGTLDPLATGLLIAATDRSTKLLPYLDDFEKIYIFEVDFSVVSASWDLGTETEPISEEAFEY